MAQRLGNIRQRDATPTLMATVRDAVQIMLQKDAKARRKTKRLLIDTFAIVSNARAAVMLDYLPMLHMDPAAQLCAHLTKTLNIPFAALGWRGCLWLINLQSLLHYCGEQLDHGPGGSQIGNHPIIHDHTWRIRIVDFFNCAGTLTASTSSILAREDIVQGLRVLQRTVSSVHDNISCTRGCSHVTAVDCSITLQDNLQIGLLPSVNGFLLGYPFVYYVTSESVGPVCKHLSTSSLVLFRVRLTFTQQDEWKQLLQRGTWQPDDDDLLMSFSVPATCLDDAEQEHIAARITARIGSVLPEGLGVVHCTHTTISMHSIVL